MINKFDDLLELLSAAPDSQFDKSITPRFAALVGQPPEKVAEELIKIRDECVFSALTSDFGIMVLSETIRIVQAEAKAA